MYLSLNPGDIFMQPSDCNNSRSEVFTLDINKHYTCSHDVCWTVGFGCAGGIGRGLDTIVAHCWPAGYVTRGQACYCEVHDTWVGVLLRGA